MVVKEGWQGRFFEDFEVGDVYRHPLGRTVTTTDNIWFTLLSQNTALIQLTASKLVYNRLILLANSLYDAPSGSSRSSPSSSYTLSSGVGKLFMQAVARAYNSSPSGPRHSSFLVVSQHSSPQAFRRSLAL